MSSSPVINLADLEIRQLDPETAPKSEPPNDYDVRWGEIASRIGEPADQHDYWEGE